MKQYEALTLKTCIKAGCEAIFIRLPIGAFFMTVIVFLVRSDLYSLDSFMIFSKQSWIESNFYKYCIVMVPVLFFVIVLYGYFRSYKPSYLAKQDDSERLLESSKK